MFFFFFKKILILDVCIYCVSRELKETSLDFLVNVPQVSLMFFLFFVCHKYKVDTNICCPGFSFPVTVE